MLDWPSGKAVGCNPIIRRFDSSIKFYDEVTFDYFKKYDNQNYMTINEISKVDSNLKIESKTKEQIDKMFKDAMLQLQLGIKVGCKRCEYCKNGRGKGSKDCLIAKNITQGFKDYFKTRNNIVNKNELQLLNIVFHCSNLSKIRNLWI